MRVAVVGSKKLCVDMEAYLPIGVTALISGDSRGVQNLATLWADKHNVPKLIIKPDYKNFGRMAAAKRDELIVELADLIVVMWDGTSAGTERTIHYARRIGKTVWVHVIKHEMVRSG